jgi:glycosyltransferase involved in cell wall biosynthesis
MHLLIITPIFSPSLGGAAIYYDLLIQGLIERGIVNRVTVITERSKERDRYDINKRADVEVVGLFPFRASGQFGKLSQYFRYGLQNLLYISIPKLIHERQPDVVLVHSSFHNYFNVINLVVRYISRKIPVIGDVRDHQLPVHRLGQLVHYHSLIACSQNVLEHVRKDNKLADRVVHIPVVQEQLASDRSKSDQTMNKYKLIRNSYLLFAGLIKTNKGVDTLLAAYRILCSRGFSGSLVLVGLARDKRLLERALRIPGVVHLGQVVRGELLDLMACSKMVINLSASESIGRTSLEALALGVDVLLPHGIPEYEFHCPESVVSSSDAKIVATQIEDLLARTTKCIYPIEQHAPDAVMKKYEILFEKVCSDF